MSGWYDILKLFKAMVVLHLLEANFFRGFPLVAGLPPTSLSFASCLLSSGVTLTSKSYFYLGFGVGYCTVCNPVAIELRGGSP